VARGFPRECPNDLVEEYQRADPELVLDSKMTWPKRVVIIVLLICFYSPAFFSLLYPSVGFWPLLGAVLLLFPLLGFSVEALVRLRWKQFAVFVVVWLSIVLPLTNVAPQPKAWMTSLGFFVKTRLAGDYLSSCRLTEFIENEVKQTIGVCHGFDRGQMFDFVVYDTTGELMLPVSQRTPEWSRVISKAVAPAVVSIEDPAYPLFGHYYVVELTILQLPEPEPDDSIK
jgi:hypothetical protein